jgi:hypothetical protein
MLLNNLLEPRVIELCEPGQIVHISDDITHVLLQQLKVFLGRRFLSIAATTVQPGNTSLDLLLGRGDATNNLLGLDLLEGVDFVEFLVELLDEVLLRLVIPLSMDAKGLLKGFVVDVIEGPVSIERLFELLAEPARR